MLTNEKTKKPCHRFHFLNLDSGKLPYRKP